MEEFHQETVIQEEPDLFHGGFLFFLLFGILFYFLTGGNYIFAFFLAFLPTGFLKNLCNNHPGRSLEFLIAFVLNLFWMKLCFQVSARLLNAIPGDAGISPLLHKASALMVVPHKMSLIAVVVFLLGYLIIFLISFPPGAGMIDQLKMPESLHKTVLFLIRLIKMVISTLVLNIVIYKILAALSYPPKFSFLIYLPLPLFLIFCWKNADNDIKKMAELQNKGKEEDKKQESKIKAMDIPDMKLSDVAGMEEVKEQIRLRMIAPLANKKEALKHGITAGGGMLLYGPPGNGKTFIARAVAGELKVPFFSITGADIFSKYIGESENNIRSIFAAVRQHELSVLFIDELESIFHKRTDDIHESTRKVISILLQELDGVQKHKNNMLLIGATNTPQMLDEAFLRTGRLDVQIFVGLPDAPAREQILNANFADVKVTIPRGLIHAVAKYTENYSGADLKGLAIRTKQKAFARKMNTYTKELFEEVLGEVRPSANGQILQQIREWERSR